MKKLRAEFFGTMMLVFFGCTAAVIGGQYGLNTLGVALVFGIALTFAIYLFGKESGGHFNPAVSFAKYLDGKLNTREFILYVISQILGAVVGVLILMFIMKNTELTLFATKTLGQNGFGDTFNQAKLTMAGAMAIEIILTFIFVLTVLNVTKDDDKKSYAPVLIGLMLALVHMIGIPLTGTSVNPARSIAPAIFTGLDSLKQLWVFIVGPMFGSLLAFLTYKCFNKNEKKRGK